MCVRVKFDVYLMAASENSELLKINFGVELTEQINGIPKKCFLKHKKTKNVPVLFSEQ